jgi:hypothetical protein
MDQDTAGSDMLQPQLLICANLLVSFFRSYSNSSLPSVTARAGSACGTSC